MDECKLNKAATSSTNTATTHTSNDSNSDNKDIFPTGGKKSKRLLEEDDSEDEQSANDTHSCHCSSNNCSCGNNAVVVTSKLKNVFTLLTPQPGTSLSRCIRMF
jgi:hypothetical protein